MLLLFFLLLPLLFKILSVFLTLLSHVNAKGHDTHSNNAACENDSECSWSTDSETVNPEVVFQIKASENCVKCKSFHENGELSRGHTIPQLVSIANAVEILSLVLHSSLWSNGTDMLQPFSNLPNCT